MICSEGIRRLRRPILQQLVSLLPDSVSGCGDLEHIAQTLLAAAATVTRLGTENQDLRAQVALLSAKLEAGQHFSDRTDEDNTEAAIAERFDIPLHALSSSEYEDKLDFITRVLAMSSLRVDPNDESAQIRVDVAYEQLMENPARFCHELEKFDDLRRKANNMRSWRKLYNDFQGGIVDLPYYLGGF